MLRSDEKNPLRATLRMADRVHASGSAYADPRLRLDVRVVAGGHEVGDFGLGEPEEEEVVVADELADLDVRAVERADGECAVERELHVPGAGGLLAGERDLLGQVGR